VNRKLYLLSLGLVIVVAALSVLLGTRYILSPVGLFQVATLLNLVVPPILGLLIAVFLSVRFADVWRDRVDTDFVVTRPIARASQLVGRVLIWAFYALLLVAIGFLVLARGQLGGEIGFLFGPLLRTLPVGLLLFELSRFLDAAVERDDI
jgi:hypothetical protein